MSTKDSEDKSERIYRDQRYDNYHTCEKRVGVDIKLFHLRSKIENLESSTGDHECVRSLELELDTVNLCVKKKFKT